MHFDTVAENAFCNQVRERALPASGHASVHGLLLIHALVVGDTNHRAQAGFESVMTMTVMDRIRTCLRQDDLSAHFGGDIFVAFIDKAVDAENLGHIARAMLSTIRQPLVIANDSIQLDARIGIATSPGDASDVNKLIACAEQSLGRLTLLGHSGYEFYDAETGCDVFRQQELTSKLSGAVENDDFHLAYQPLFDARTGQLIGAEALLRWTDGEGNRQQPAEFVPLLEKSGLISNVGTWVLQKACYQAQRWRKAGFPEFRISVNLSPLQLMEQNLVERIAAILDETGLPASAMELEITESVFLQRPERAISQLHALIEMGARPFIDDFGVGFSSIGLLKQLPVTGIKIDQSFVADIDRTAHDLMIVKAIVNLAQGFGLNIVAEGVETRQQADLLTDLGVHTLQGFLFSPGLAPEDFTVRFLSRSGSSC